MPQKTPSPRTDRTRRRRAAQEANANKAADEIKNLTSPESAEKAARIAENKAKAAAEAQAPGGARKARQAVNRAKAAEEDAKLGHVDLSVPEKPALIPGKQVDLQTAIRHARIDDISERDYATEAGRAAGLAVRDTLRDRPLRDRHKRSRHIAQHNARVEAAARKAQQ